LRGGGYGRASVVVGLVISFESSTSDRRGCGDDGKLMSGGSRAAIVATGRPAILRHHDYSPSLCDKMQIVER